MNLSELVDIARRTSSEVWIPLITIEEISLAAPIRLAVYDEDVVSNGETFVAAPGIDVKPPDESEDSSGEARLVLPVVDQTILDAAENFAGQATVTIGVVVLSNPDQVVVQTSNLRVVQHVTNLRTMQFVLAGPRFLTDTVPSDLMTRSRVPGIFL